MSKTRNLTMSAEQRRHFRMLMQGSAISMLGSRVTTIAYPMLVLYLTSSPVAAGWVGFAAIAPSVVLYVPAGALVDRWNPRRAMLISETGRGIAIATVVVALAVSRPSVLLLVAIAIVEESLEVFSSLAEQNYIHSLVTSDQATSALARSEARTHMAVLVGRPLGGLMFGLAPIFPFAFDVASFLVSVGFLADIRGDRSKLASSLHSKGIISRFTRASEPETFSQRGHGRRLGSEIREGLSWVNHDRFARAALPLAASATLIGQALIMIFLAEAHARHLSPVSVGIALAASGVGGTLGSLAGSRIINYFRLSWMKWQMSIWAVPLLVLALRGGQSSIWMTVAIAVFGFTGAISNIELNAYLMRKVKRSMLSRVQGYGRLISYSALAAGPAIGGILAEWCRPDLGIYILLGLVIGLALVSIRSLSVTDLADAQAGSDLDEDRPTQPFDLVPSGSHAS